MNKGVGGVGGGLGGMGCVTAESGVAGITTQPTKAKPLTDALGALRVAADLNLQQMQRGAVARQEQEVLRCERSVRQATGQT